MSSDMFSSLVDKDIKLTENIFSFHELEYRQWEEFSEPCLIRRHTLCGLNDRACKKDTCFAWQLIEFIKFGKL